MSYEYISEDDKVLIYSLCLKNKGFTYEGIATMFKGKYPDINENIVGKIVREKHSEASDIIDFNSRLKQGIQFQKTDLQASRRKD